MHSLEMSEGNSSISSLREEQYLKAREYHMKFDIQIPDLEESQSKGTKGSLPIATYHSRENKSADKENYNKSTLVVSPSASYMRPKRQINTELTSEYTFSPNIHAFSKGMERSVDHLYKWKESVEKKKEMQRELQSVIEESNIEKKIYTNKRSEDLIAYSRPALRIEDSFMLREDIRKQKLKRLEESMYERPNIPEITEKASRMKPKADLLTRLYHQPLQKKLNETQQTNSSRSLTPSIRTEPKKRAFSPFTSPVGHSGEISNRRPLTATSKKHQHNYASERTFQNGKTPGSGGQPKMGLTRKALPFGQNGSLDGEVFENSIQQSQLDSSLSTKRIAPNFHGEKSNLPNKFFFAGQKDPLQEKFAAFEKFLAKQDLKPVENVDGTFDAPSHTETFIKQFENDMSASRETSQVLRIQKASTTESHNKSLANCSLQERNQIWLQQKNKKIQSKQEQKKAKELEGCTFQPTLNKKAPPKKLELSLVPNFKQQVLVQLPSQIPIRRIITPTQKVNSEEQHALLKQRAATPKVEYNARDQKEANSKIDVNMPPRSVNVKIHIDEYRNHFNIYNVNRPSSPQKSSIYNDFEKQKKLINYILDSEKLKANPTKSNA